MTTTSCTYLILGAGPTGLAAANRLRELGEDSFLVLERHGHAGGLAASFTDGAGFTWDIGGHVVFSHYAYFDSLLDSLLGEDVLRHQRISSVRIAGGWVPYPFQNNIRHLPPELRWECVRELLPGRRPEGEPENFLQWCETVFGKGISRLFMAPYNFKVWATPPALMGYRWIGERVSVVSLEQVLRTIVLGEDDVAWGPNNTFGFPLRGGTGEIFRRLAARIADRVVYDAEAAAVDPVRKEVRTADGRVFAYEHLLSTMPLDLLAGSLMSGAPDAVREAAKSLAHNSVHVAGVGVADTREDPTCWMYFPEDDCPFYRVTNFHNYSPNNVAEPGRQRGLMAETSSSPHKPVDKTAVLEHTLRGLENTTLTHPGTEVVSAWQHDVEYGYPVPTLGRDKALGIVQPWLEERSVFSRGRFGGWKYEVANMDHSVMQGVEWAERMLSDTRETTYTL
ncbi:amine oxidase, flavin-containing [Desulfovibrio sp. X2]|uniref:protoporphyrinogen/coproporphyrinogen oxidase n=1 Tax=Desulfovibrio sp. X2 TaxID=941449 RepID=UPI0003587D06|nr:FAD-dependent oxidoreductase [Desulfovibrio sp. X2]EPR44225.1 amine oxidase, flavin-containing [Desulfovibrio sp. X2]